MVDRDGFTLIEMLAAIAVLTVGLTGLIALMSSGVSTRATAELRDRAVRAADVVFALVENQVLAEQRAEADGDLPEMERVVYDPIRGFPRLRAVVDFTEDPDHPRLVLVAARITWQEEGVAVGEVFRRVTNRGAPFPARIRRIKDKP